MSSSLLARLFTSAGLVVALGAGTARAVDKVPKGYTVVRENKAGRAMTIEKNNQANVHDAIEESLNDLDDYFDDDYDVFGLYENQRDHKSAISPFTAKYDGHPVKGFVATKMKEKTAVNIVVFARTDATPAEWTELTGTPAAPGGAGPAPTNPLGTAESSPLATGGNPLAAEGNPLAGEPAGGPSAHAQPGNPLGGPSPRDSAARNPLAESGPSPRDRMPAGETVTLPPRFDLPGQENPVSDRPPERSAVARAPDRAALESAPVGDVQLREYRFPDGTGSVGLPEGWTTQAQSCQNGFEVNGPGDQKINFGSAYSISTPNSTAVQMARQYPVPGQVLLVAPFGEPADVVMNLIPQLSRISQARGGPAVEIDHMNKVKDLPPQSQGSRWALLGYGVTRTTREGAKHYQAVLQAGVIPIANDSFMLWSTQAVAPDATARQDFPVMFQITSSWRTNDAVVQANTQAWVAGRQQWFAGQQAAHKTVTDGFDAQNANWRKNQTIQSRSADNFDETIRGYRSVEDTRTGEQHQVDLGNVDHVVDQLNEGDPGRYKQIPLRDQADPLPGR